MGKQIFPLKEDPDFDECFFFGFEKCLTLCLDVKSDLKAPKCLNFDGSGFRRLYKKKVYLSAEKRRLQRRRKRVNV